MCYVDSTIGVPIHTAYALAKRKPRQPKRLFDRRETLLEQITKEFRDKFGNVPLSTL